MFKLIDFVDCIFYINLPHRTDKNSAMLAHLKELDLESKVIRIDGKTPAELGCLPLADGGYKIEQYSAGNAAAHMEIVKKAKAQGMNNILVLEDDCRIYADNQPPLNPTEAAIEQISKIKDWEILFLGATIVDENLDLISPNLVKVSVTVCSHAFILNYRAFDVLLNTNPKIYYDCCLSRSLNQKYVVYPLGAIQVHLNKTDIGDTCTRDLNFWQSQLKKPIKNSVS
jgi:hypothetical protein